MNKKLFSDARTALRKKNVSDVISLSNKLINSDHLPDHASGYLLRGMAYEVGGDGIEIDLKKAVEFYRKAAYLHPDTVAFVFMARALMKQGGSNHLDALKYLQEASAVRNTPELNLAYARYYESVPIMNYELARKYYLRAAFSGRFVGFFGYAEMSRKLGQRLRAISVDCMRIMLGPLLFILLGSTASKGF